MAHKGQGIAGKHNEHSIAGTAQLAKHCEPTPMRKSSQQSTTDTQYYRHSFTSTALQAKHSAIISTSFLMLRSPAVRQTL